ncbi:MAG: NAD(P)H-binding protein [Roseovarius sp.]|nr:NAD(P)H-binding protein [Roseovarius sp.]
MQEMMPSPGDPTTPKRVLLLGASGTIGRATLAALLARGHEVVCLLREGGDRGLPTGATSEIGDVGDPGALARVFGAGRFDAVMSCMASRSGTPQDAWAVDHGAHMAVLAAAKAAGVGQFVLLSAICVQRPLLGFQHAKLAFEAALQASGMTYCILRPTAFFKSLSGQIARVQQGKPYLLFGDGTLTACKPISDADLGAYLADCLSDSSRHNRILPIGGPGPAITPREQGEEIFRLLGRAPKFRSVPVGMMDAIIAVLGALGRLSPRLRDKAELARIGRYYATESMLVLDASRGQYDADATPETGQDRLFEYYAEVINGTAKVERGDHAVF